MKTAAETLSELLAMNLSKEDSILLAFSQGVIIGYRKHEEMINSQQCDRPLGGRGLAASQGER